MKADPGMGKTTLGRKMSCDWARGTFQKFSVIFFVALKLVKPGDLIENVIIQQNPELEGLHVSEPKLRAMLNGFSNRILLILDGFDEHGLETNRDVLKIIKNQKLLDCRIVVSSHPHSTWKIEEYFPTIVRVDGFTEKEARKFVSNFFTDENKIEQIMKFRPSDSREDFPVHKCPILLAILCFLVHRQEVRLSDRNITIGDIYFKMVKYLYRKFTLKKGVEFEQTKLLKVITSVGHLAIRTLLSDSPLLQRSEVLKIAGEFALDYGFLAGDKDFTDPTADLNVTYAHSSIEEFFGSFGFIQALDDGNTIDEILGSDCEQPIFMMNPLVLQFCLWLLTKDFYNSRGNIYQELVLFVAKRIDFHLLDVLAVEEMYPAISIGDALLCKESLKLKFFKHVLEKCQCVRLLRIRNKKGLMCDYEQVDGILELMSSNLLSKLTCLSITGEYSVPSIHRDPWAISINPTDPDTLHKYLNILLPKYNLLKRNPQVHAEVDCHKSHDLSTLIAKHIKQLHFLWRTIDSPDTLFVSEELPDCPQLTHFTLENCHIDDSVPFSFVKAVQEGKLPNLKRIELIHCKGSDCRWPSVPEFFLQARGKLDSSQMPKLLSKLTELTVDKLLDTDLVVPVQVENLTVLKLNDVDDQSLTQINNVIEKGKLPNVSKLFMAASRAGKAREFDTFFQEFQPHKTLNLEKLALQRFIISAEGLEILSEKLTAIQLTEIDLTYSRGFTGSLSALFTHIFPRLNKLIMSHCGLNANDLQSLARANVEGKLPQLRHLDISTNSGFNISDLFTHSAHWDQLTTLETSDVNVLNVDPECLTSLEELFLPAQGTQPPSVTQQWPCLKVIEVNNEHTARCLADGVEQGMFPSLATVRCESLYYERPFFFKLLKANISVEPCVL